jgi:uncharacterized protein with WD repeat
MLWGGENWTNLGKFQHSAVDRIEFSPNEKYLTTVSFRESEEVNMKIFKNHLLKILQFKI